MKIFKFKIVLIFYILLITSCKKQEIRKENLKEEPNIQPVLGDCELLPNSASLDNSHILLGNPDNAQKSVLFAENYLLDQTYYVISYSSSRGIPNWVSWHLTYSDYSTGTRNDDFRTDPALSSTGFYQVKATSYQNSGFDRGHNCPSGDRTSNPTANSATFLMTNMIPQAPKNNQGPWATLESFIRSNFTDKGKECYIIMGSYGIGGDGSNGTAQKIDNNRVTVPAKIWKVVLVLDNGDNDLSRINSNTITIAVDMPNSQSINTNWKSHITTIKSIEDSVKNKSNANFSLLSNLPKCVKTALANKSYN